MCLATVRSLSVFSYGKKSFWNIITYIESWLWNDSVEENKILSSGLVDRVPRGVIISKVSSVCWWFPGG